MEIKETDTFIFPKTAVFAVQNGLLQKNVRRGTEVQKLPPLFLLRRNTVDETGEALDFQIALVLPPRSVVSLAMVQAKLGKS